MYNECHANNSSVISDIQSASIAQCLEPRLFKPAVVGSSLGGGGHVPATLRSSYLLINNRYARHELKKQKTKKKTELLTNTSIVIKFY